MFDQRPFSSGNMMSPGTPLTEDMNRCCPPTSPCSPGNPVVEPTVERCVTRNVCHNVRHICPIHTRVINNHIFQHTYEPCYTCSEQNVVSNVQQGSCCDFL